MAMVMCGEDEFGNLFADVHVEDVHALRGFGSLQWSLKDEYDSFANTPPEGLPAASVHGCDANVNTAQVELDTSLQCKSMNDNREEHENKRKYGTTGTAGIACRADDLATDSDDDLRIVLDPLQKSVNEGIADDSEDGEDFVVLTGNGQEWRENSIVPTEDSAQAKVVGGEKIGLCADEQVQNQKTFEVRPHICYGGQAYRRHYRYVRANCIGRWGAVSTGNAWLANRKSSFAKSKRIGSGRGYMNSQRLAGGNGAARGLSSGPEYILPSNKTVFDIDIDAFKEKPWRLSNVNVSDYFNFELDESGWKKYCKQLMQFCLEVATESKISVYEGGRIGQPTAGDIQVGAGRRTLTAVQGQRFRDSDAIFLIDVKEDEMPESCSKDYQANFGVACKVLDSGGVNSKLILDNKMCKPEKEQPLVERSMPANQKRTNALLTKFSVNELQENGSVATVSRLKTPSPATPPKGLPTRGKRDVMVCGKRQNSGSKNWQADHDSAGLPKSKENLQLTEIRTSRGAESLDAASEPITDSHASRRKVSKRVAAHAIAAQMIKKRKLDAHQANHGCRFASLLIKKLSRVRATEAISVPQLEADTIQRGNGFPRDKTSECSIAKIALGNAINAQSCEHVTEVTERQENPHSMDNNSSKKKGKASLSKVRDVLDIPCESVKEKSREKLKVKKSKKGHKGKQRVKSKDKLHLPGCPNFKKGLKKNDLMEGTGNMSMIGFISNDNKVYWKKVDSLCQRNIEDHGVEKSVIYQCQETKQRTEYSSVLDRTDGHYIMAGGGGECKKRILKTPFERRSHSINAETRGCNDELLEGNLMESCNGLKVLQGKQNDVKHMLIKEMRLASTKAHLLANSTHETHTNVSKQALIGEQLTFMEKRKHFGDKGRELIPGQLHLESEYKVQGLTDLALVNGQNNKKKHSKKYSHIFSCKDSNKLIHSVDQEEEQSNRFNKLKTYVAATKRSRNLANIVDDRDKSRVAVLESCQREPLSMKVERTTGASRKMLGNRLQKVDKHVKQTKWHCQETKSFWAFSI